MTTTTTLHWDHVIGKHTDPLAVREVWETTHEGRTVQVDYDGLGSNPYGWVVLAGARYVATGSADSFEAAQAAAVSAVDFYTIG